MHVQEQQQASAEQQAKLRLRLAGAESREVAAVAELNHLTISSADAAQVNLQDAHSCSAQSVFGSDPCIVPCYIACALCCVSDSLLLTFGSLSALNN